MGVDAGAGSWPSPTRPTSLRSVPPRTTLTLARFTHSLQTHKIPIRTKKDYEKSIQEPLKAQQMSEWLVFQRLLVPTVGSEMKDKPKSTTLIKEDLKAEEITASALCRRRIPVVMVRLKMAETMRAAVTFVEQGQVRVGPHAVTDPAFLVTKSMEDYVTWVDTSKVRRAVQKYNDKLDDFDLL